MQGCGPTSASAVLKAANIHTLALQSTDAKILLLDVTRAELMWLSIIVTPPTELQLLHSCNKQHRTAKHQWVAAHYAFRVAESLQTKPVTFASAHEVPHGS
jgi:hypothetical protein